MLSQQQIDFFNTKGYLILPKFKSMQDVTCLRARANAIVDAFDPSHGSSIFTTRNHDRSKDDYFLDSANDVSCFFEEDAFDATGTLRQAKSLSINKIGHALHDLDPVFERFSRNEKLASLAAALGMVDEQIWQSMYIFKQPGIGGEVRWHQDATYFDTNPITVTTFWFALEDATLENGCLWVEPGGHHGPLRERFIREGRQVRIEKLDDTPWPSNDTAVPVEVEAGTLVCFHGLLPHYSAPNRSPISRHAFTLHVTDGRSEYSRSNWIQRGAALPVRGFTANASMDA